MATNYIKFKRSAVPGKRPSTNQVELGELALNTNDGRLFTKKEAVGIGTTVTLLNVWTENPGGSVYYNDGNVGIGTTNPQSTLAVGGTITELYGGQYWNVVTQADVGYGASQVPLNQYLGQLAFLDDFSPNGLRRDGGGEDDVTVNSSGFVGIGTTNPQSTFQVNGNSVINGNLNVSIGGTYNLITTLKGEASGYNVSGIAVTQTRYGIGIGTTNPFIPFYSDSDSQIFNTFTFYDTEWIVANSFNNSVTRMGADNGRSFEIGMGNTDLPKYIDFGGGNFPQLLYTDYQARLIRNGTDDGGLQILNRGSGTVSISAGQTSGELGNFDIFTANTRRLRVSSTGNVGINVLNPTSRLHVSGDTLVTGVVTATTFFGNITGNLNSSGVNTATTISGTTLNYNTANILSGVITSLTSSNATLTNINSSGITTLTNLTSTQLNVSGIATISVNSSNDALRITQSGSGNAFVVEDSANPDSSAFVIKGGGYGWVGIGTTNPREELHLQSVDPVIRFVDEDATTNNRNWNVGANNETFYFQAINDSGSGGGDTFRFTRSSSEIVSFEGRSSANTWFVVNNSTQRVGIGTTNPTSRLHVSGDTLVTGVVTATTFVGSLTGIAGSATRLVTPRTFEITGDVVASAISFDGTGNVSLAATIQPNSVGLGTDTTGDYVQSISGTSNQITVTSGTGEGSTPTLSIPSQFTAPQDVTVTRDLQVNRNLNVTGNITIGGTSATLFTTELKVSDPDIVLGFRTDSNNNDVSNDTTANHGGISVASTEGSPLVSIYNPGIGESTLPTYKKIMWFKSGSFAGLNTDAWLINYAVGIGSTQFPTRTHLAVGNVQFTQNDLAVIRNINSSGVGTIPTLSGTTATYTTGNFTTGNIVTGIVTNISGTNLNYTGVGTITSLNSTNVTLTNINSSGVSTLGITTFTGAVSFGTSAYFGDNDILYFGDGNDLRIYHDGGNSIIGDFGTGNLYLTGDNNVLITNAAGSETKASFISNGPVGLYFDNVKEFETTGYGATVFGILQTQGLQSSGIATISVNSSNDALRITQTGTGNALVVEDSANPDSSAFVITSSGSVGIGSTNPTVKLEVDGTIGFNGTNIRLGDSTTNTSIDGDYNFFAGVGAGELAITGYNNNFIGYQVGYSNIGGNYNNFLGYQVGYTNNSGTGNNFLGNSAGYTNFDGSYNNFIGEQSGYNNSDGSENIFIGSLAGFVNNTGNGNVFLGSYAGYNVTGSYNVAVGFSAEPAIPGGSTQLAIGSNGVNWIYGNSSGNIGIGTTNPTEKLDVVGNIKLTGSIYGPSTLIIDPAVVGDDTGAVRIKGDLYVDGTQFIVNSSTIELADFNVGIATTVGTNALLDGAGIGIGSTGIRKTITWNNTAGALTSSEDWNLVSGKQYEINGTSVLSSTTLGSGVINSSLTSVGTLGQLNVSGVATATTFVGNLTGTATTSTNVVGAANRILYNSATNTTTTSSNLSYDGNFVAITRSGDLGLLLRSGFSTSNTGISVGRNNGDLTIAVAGAPGQYANNAAQGDIIFRSEFSGRFLFNRQATNASLAIDGSNILVGSVSSTGTASQPLQVTGGAYVSGNLGIGTANPTSRLHIQGDALITGVTTSTDFNSASDIRLKENIKPIENPIDKILNITGVSFDWKETGKSSMGVIAQDIEKVLPELVNGEETKTVNYNGLIGLLIEVVKEQQNQINILKEKLG
jgi:hypothetical protein